MRACVCIDRCQRVGVEMAGVIRKNGSVISRADERMCRLVAAAAVVEKLCSGECNGRFFLLSILNIFFSLSLSLFFLNK